MPFLPALRAGFVNWDDGVFLVQNMIVQKLTWRGLLPLFTSFDGGYFQPLADLSMALQYRVWGPHPAGYHAFNVVVHALNAVLFWAIARRLFSWNRAAGAAEEAGAVAAALLFSVHPLRVESVAWVSEWRDVQSGLFFLCAVYAHLRMVRAPARRRGAWRGAIAGATACCVLTKLMGITLPVVLLLLDFCPLGRWEDEPVLREKWALFVIAGSQALIGWMGALVSDSVTPLGWGAKLGQITYGLGFYLWKTAVPSGLSPMYEASWLLNPGPFLLYGGTALACLGVCWSVRRRHPAAATAAAYYVLTLLPVIGLIRSGRQIVADRFSYLPCLCWALLLGGAVRLAWRRRPRLAASAAAALLLGLAAATWRQCGVWRTPITLWSGVLDVEPRNYFARYRLAAYLKEVGLTDQGERQREAAYADELEIFQRAYEAYSRRGDRARAADCLRKVEQLRAHPDYSL